MGRPRGGDHRRSAAAGLTLAIVLAVTGCGGSSHKPAHATQPGGSTHSTTTTTVPQSKGIATLQDVAGDPGQPVRTRVTIYDLRRSGPFLVLDFGYVCLIPGSGCDVPAAFAVPETKESGTAFVAGAHTPNGVSLVDPIADKQYLPVTDALQRPDTSVLADSVTDSALHLAWVKFPAPPASVSSLDVLFPNGGPVVSRVPISSSLAAPGASSTVQAAQPSPFATAPDSTNTTGLTLPVEDLVLTAGNPSGSDSESASRAVVTLHSDVLFHFAKSSLTSRARAILVGLAAKVKARATGQVAVAGYTDSIGTDQVNIPLSRARAASVVATLRPLTPGVSYSAKGYGSADPVAPNTNPDGSDDPAGRALNRRVTISFAIKAPAKPAPPVPSSGAPSQQGSASGQTIAYRANEGYGTSSYNVGIDRMFREGNLTVLELTVTCTGATGRFASSGCSGEWDFAGTQTTPPVPVNQNDVINSYNASTANAFYLLDPATGTEYIPVYDSSGAPLSAGVTPFSWPPGVSYPLWIYFPAPPGSSATVVLPGGGARAGGVPIAASP